MKDQQALSMRFMTILSERDIALQERDLALSERKIALAERDMALMQRDAAIAERNNALFERDNVIAAFEYRENMMMSDSSSPNCQERLSASNEARDMHHSENMQRPPLEHVQHPACLAEAQYHTREMHFADALPFPGSTSEIDKPQRSKRSRGTELVMLKKTSKPSRRGRTVSGELNKQLAVFEVNLWKTDHNMVGGCGDDLNKETPSPKEEWKDQDLGLNQIIFDDSSMPVPICSCTGRPQQCYKWGNGGWQSACCNNTISMYPLPMMPNKRHTRVSGRKMSASAFTKLLSRLAIDGYDLSAPVDLKDHWAKHGTNRYITIK